MRWMMLAIGVLIAACTGTDARPPLGACTSVEVYNREPCPERRDRPSLGYEPG